MHRLKTLTATVALLLPIAILACGGGGKKPAKTSHDESAADAGSDDTSGFGGGTAGGDADGGSAGCTGFEEPKLDEALMKVACEMKDTSASQGSVDVKDKLEIRVMPFPTKVVQSGIMEIVVSFVNKSKEPLTLYFQINPEPHFTVEAYDAKNKRVDIPGGNPPPFPKDMAQPVSAEPKIAKYTIAPNGNGKVKLNWTAAKMKWDPSKVKGAILDRGYPRTVAGPLPKGKYTLRVITPLVGVFEGVEHEVTAPKIQIEVN